MKHFAGLMAVLFSFVCVTSAAIADEARVPPRDYAKRHYVDGDGCLFTRSEVSGWEIWVQRLDEQKKPICGMVPSGVAPADKVPLGVPDANT